MLHTGACAYYGSHITPQQKCMAPRFDNPSAQRVR